MMRNGIVFQQQPLAPRTGEIDCSLWPTPRASPNENRQTKMTPSQKAGKHGMSLCAAVNARQMWPTPTVNGNHNRKGLSPNSGDGLATAVKREMLPTPTVNDAKNSTLPPSQINRDLTVGATMRDGASGQLNPTWVEWLMGFPEGWTDCED
jgi:hypothetical protein